MVSNQERRAAIVPWINCGSLSTGRFAPPSDSGYALYEKNTKTKRRRSIGQQPGTKSAFRPAYKPLVNRWLRAVVVPPSVYIGCPSLVLLKIRSGQVCSMPWRARGTVFVGEPTHRRPVLPGSAPPRCPAMRRPDPTRPSYVRVLGSTGRKWECRLFSGRTDTSASRPARPRPARPSCRAPPRPDTPVVCPGF